MKKFVVLILLSMIILPNQAVLAENNATSSGRPNLIQQLNNKKEEAKATLERVKNTLREKIRTNVKSHAENAARILIKEETLLSKLQLRIDRVKAAGKNVDSMNKLMIDSRSKLDDAKARLLKVEPLLSTAMDKATFESIKAEFKIIGQDFHQVRLNSAKVISSLKAFNRSLNAPTPKVSTSSATQ